MAENCIFEESPAACLNAGFRPCKRCTPLTAAAAQEPAIVALLEALEARPDHRWSEQDVAALGHDLSTIRRGFKRHFGMTFLEMARLRRIRAGFEALGQGERVIDAQIDAGFDSPSAFRAGFAKALGLPPADLRPVGALLLSVVLLMLARRLTRSGADLGSEADGATYRALHEAGRAAVHLRVGLAGSGADLDRAARHLRLLLGAKPIEALDPDTGAGTFFRRHVAPAAGMIKHALALLGIRQVPAIAHRLQQQLALLGI